MEVTWTAEAENSLSEILEFWDIHNDSPTYSDKILAEVKKYYTTLQIILIF